MEKQVIGITGGIGCGKSAVMDILKREHQAALLLTDQIAHELMEPGRDNYKEIVKTFGKEVLGTGRSIDRKKLGAIVFCQKEKLEQLNEITHPNILCETKKRIRSCQTDPGIAIVCLESALLLDTPLESLCREIWYIFADEETRIKRLMEGRGYTREHCRLVMSRQKPESAFSRRADRIIDNSGAIEDTRGQIRLALGLLAEGGSNPNPYSSPREKGVL